MNTSRRSAWLRFEVLAALSLGVLLPTLETVRRGFAHWSVNFTTMFEDYFAGMALLAAAAGTAWRARWAPGWMVVTWSGVTFMMLSSTVNQVERQLRDDLEPHSLVVLVIKLLLTVASAYALWRSLKAPAADPVLRTAGSSSPSAC